MSINVIGGCHFTPNAVGEIQMFSGKGTSSPNPSILIATISIPSFKGI